MGVIGLFLLSLLSQMRVWFPFFHCACHFPFTFFIQSTPTYR